MLSAEGHRRLIGNDIALLLFLEDDVAPFDASFLTDLGAVPQIYVLVQPIKPLPNATPSDIKYRVVACSKSSLKTFSPKSPNSTSIVLTAAEMKDFVLTKLYNGYMMSRQCMPLMRLYQVPRQNTLDRFASLSHHYLFK